MPFRRSTYNVQSQLVQAAKIGNVDAIRTCILNGGDINADNGAALAHAAIHGHAHVIKMLVDEYGADVNINDGFALRRAAAMKHEAAVQVLIARGADPNAYDGQPLVSAATWNMGAMAALLIRAGADVHVQENLPVLRAFCHGHASVISLLLQCGADPFAVRNSKDYHRTDRMLGPCRQLIDEAVTAEKIFLAGLLNADKNNVDVLFFPVKGMHGHETGETGFIRAAKMGLLTDAMNLFDQKSGIVTKELLFGMTDRKGRSLIHFLMEAGMLSQVFIPSKWNGDIGAMSQSWIRYWNSLDDGQKAESSLLPEDIEKRIADHRRLILKNRATILPRP